MTLIHSASARRAVRLAVAALALAALCVGVRPPALAAPSAPAAAPVSASLEASTDAVPVGGTFGYTAHVRLTEPASYLQARLQVRRPSGQLVYQRTQIDNDVSAGTVPFNFTRQLDVLGLKPGAYPVEFSVRATVNGSTESTTVAADLLVYDPSKPPVTVILVARVNGPPMFDPQGRLIVDPATETQRADVDRIATLVTGDAFASVTLAVPPVLLEQWRRLSTGYTSLDGTSVAATEPTPQAYAATLTNLQAAIATGRLELVTLGYADPNLSDLQAGGLSADTAPQYDAGISACFASLETTPSTGTVPAGGCIPPATLGMLADHGVGYIVANGACVRQGKSAVASGVYPIARTRLNALVGDVPASRSLQSAETSTAVRRAFDRLGTARAAQPFVVAVELGDGRLDATSTVVAAAAAFETLNWAQLGLGRQTVPPRGTKEVTTVADKPSSHMPAGFWPQVASARKNARALISALGPGDSDAAVAQNDSLVAESSAWSEPGDTWALAPRGVNFAAATVKTAKNIFGKIRVTIESVTLSGAKGEVPVTINNATNKTLSVVIHVKPSGGIGVATPRIPTVLRPRDNFVQIPVETQAALGGGVDVQVVAGGLVIAHRTAEVRASYLDRLALLGAVFVALGILLAFILRRVRRPTDADEPTDSADDVEDVGERYTGKHHATGHETDTQ